MFFATYIQRLHDCIEPETNRGKFTQKILELIVTNQKSVSYSMSSYNGFFDGKTESKGNDKMIVGDMIGNCAKKMVYYLDVSEDKVNTLPRFKKYLKDLQFNIHAKNKLCDSFRCELPDINVDNYIDELSELLIKIIKEAAGKANIEEPINLQTYDSNKDGKEESESTTITAYIFKLITILNNLLRAGKIYAKNVNNSPLSTPYSRISGRDELSNWFNKYQELNTNLNSYYEIYKCQLLEPALPFKDKFNIDSFWRCHSTREPKAVDILEDITKYKNVLIEILKMIKDDAVK